MQERGTGTIQGLEKLPPRERQQQLWVVRETLEVQLSLHAFQEVSESRQASVLGDQMVKGSRHTCFAVGEATRYENE